MAAAADRIMRTRLTNNGIREAICHLMTVAREHLSDDNFADRIEMAMQAMWELRRTRSRQLGEHAAGLIRDGDTILAHCWNESGLIDTLATALRAGRRLKVLCTETRPYLQGARLTAHSVAEMGLEVTVITDGTAAHAMSRGVVSRLLTGAERITLSGHVINTIGTLEIALAARHYDVPYIVLVRKPDAHATTPEAKFEDRNGDAVTHCLGTRTASSLVKGWYPAYDVTPPELISAVVTSDGIFPALALQSHFG
jgi:methylthioribose-1-phosphate isomerase